MSQNWGSSDADGRFQLPLHLPYEQAFQAPPTNPERRKPSVSREPAHRKEELALLSRSYRVNS